MTVVELIDKLEKLPPTLIVMLEIEGCTWELEDRAIDVRQNEVVLTE